MSESTSERLEREIKKTIDSFQPLKDFDDR